MDIAATIFHAPLSMLRWLRNTSAEHQAVEDHNVAMGRCRCGRTKPESEWKCSDCYSGEQW